MNLYSRAVQKRCEFAVGASSSSECQAQPQVEFPTEASPLERSLSIIAPAEVTQRKSSQGLFVFFTSPV